MRRTVRGDGRAASHHQHEDIAVTPNSIRSPLLCDWRADVDALVARAAAVTTGLTPAQFVQRPADGGWSIAEVFEHLVVTDGLYLPKLEQLVMRAPRPASVPAWTPGFFGRWLLKAIDPSNTAKTNSPPAFRPGPAVRPKVVGAFLDHMARYASLLEAADGADLNAPRMGSPALFLIRLNLGDALRVQIVHAQRHLGQCERVRRSVAAE